MLLSKKKKKERDFMLWRWMGFFSHLLLVCSILKTQISAKYELMKFFFNIAG